MFPQMNSLENLIIKRLLTMLKDCFLLQFSREFSKKSMLFKHRIMLGVSKVIYLLCCDTLVTPLTPFKQGANADVQRVVTP